MPSSILNFNFNSLELSCEKYFNINLNKKNAKFDDKTLENDLTDVVKKNLISDTKVGVFLSGGIDSTIISILAKKLNKDVEAYSSYFTPKDKFSKFNIDYDFAEKICNQFEIKLNKVAINENDENQKKVLLSAFKFG